MVGPAEVRIVKEIVHRATLEINVRPLVGTAGASFVLYTVDSHSLLTMIGPPSKSLETTLLALLTPLILLSSHPRSLIQLNLQTTSLPSTKFIHEISTDHSVVDVDSRKGNGNRKRNGRHDEGRRRLGKGRSAAGEKAAGINAAVVALLDAGVELRGLITAVAIAFLPSPIAPSSSTTPTTITSTTGARSNEKERIILDPTPAEEESSTSTHVISYSFGEEIGGVEGICVGVDSIGNFSVEQVSFLPSSSFLLSIRSDACVMVRVLIDLVWIVVRSGRTGARSLSENSRFYQTEHRNSLQRHWCDDDEGEGNDGIEDDSCGGG